MHQPLRVQGRSGAPADAPEGTPTPEGASTPKVAPTPEVAPTPKDAPTTPKVARIPRGAEYVTVGHVTRDVITRGRGPAVSQPGGAAFYSALQAARLGLRALIVTQGVEEEIRGLLAPYLDELQVCVIPAAYTTTLATSWEGESRHQRVLAWAGPISRAIEVHTRILHFAPVARESRIGWEGSARFVGITPQGLLRRWREDREGKRPAGEMTLGTLARERLPTRFDAAVIGEQERPHCDSLFAAARRLRAPVAVTAGGRPTTVHLPSGEDRPRVARAAVSSVAVRGDLGAGDVFATAFFVALERGRDALEAARFGNAAAAVRIVGDGPGAVGTHSEIEATQLAIDSDSQ